MYGTRSIQIYVTVCRSTCTDLSSFHGTPLKWQEQGCTNLSHRCLKAPYSTMNMPWSLGSVNTHNLIAWLYFIAFYVYTREGQKASRRCHRSRAVCTSVGSWHLHKIKQSHHQPEFVELRPTQRRQEVCYWSKPVFEGCPHLFAGQGNIDSELSMLSSTHHDRHCDLSKKMCFFLHWLWNSLHWR